MQLRLWFSLKKVFLKLLIQLAGKQRENLPLRIGHYNGNVFLLSLKDVA